MMYVGHLSFDGHSMNETVRESTRGWFTCVVEADSVDSAVEKLRELVTTSKGLFVSFEDVDHVYLDDLTEVEKVPERGVLAHFEHMYDDPPSSISVSLPGVPDEFCRSYSWGIGDEDGDEAEGEEVEPFVSFGE